MSSGFSPVTVKYRRCTVSRYSDEICCRRLLKLSIESFSFFLSPFTTEVLVRSEDEPGPQPGKLRFEALARSSASSLTLISLAFLRARDTSASMRDRRSFTALALWRVWELSCEERSVWLRRSSSLSSSLTDSTSSKNLSRLIPVCPAGPISISWWWWSGEGCSLRKREKEPENKSFILVLWGIQSSKFSNTCIIFGGELGNGFPGNCEKVYWEMMIWEEVYVMNGKEKEREKWQMRNGQIGSRCLPFQLKKFRMEAE